jgi:hypothetical protein
MDTDVTEPAAVWKAVHEADALGQEAFLERYGYARARAYYLVLGGKRYDSKAIYGVARGIEHHGLGPLKPEEFSGGEAVVARRLRALGFCVIREPIKTEHDVHLVLVENEVTYGGKYDHWKDETGVRYQFPNGYRNRVQPNRVFVYYRGVRRRNRSRGLPEYFGAGRIGRVWRDKSLPLDAPRRLWKWFCSIEDYVPFLTPVPAKTKSSVFEHVPEPFGWRTGVRELTAEAYGAILAAAGVQTSPGTSEPPAPVLPSIDSIRPTIADDLSAVVLPRHALGSEEDGDSGTGDHVARRRSAYAKKIGDHAETIVLRWLADALPVKCGASLEWLSRIGRTPGWDIEYHDEAGSIIAVEVKGTSASAFAGIEVTAREWDAARRLREGYFLILVSACLSQKPIITPVRDPYRLLESKSLEASPSAWRLDICSQAPVLLGTCEVTRLSSGNGD